MTVIAQQRLSVPATVARGFQAFVDVLSWIEEVPAEATGALVFEDGLVLLERGRVCWAVCEETGSHFTEHLCARANPPVERRRLEAVYRHCKSLAMPLGAALLESGLVSESDLRTAFRAHARESIAGLSRTMAVPIRFDRLPGGSYDQRFLFTTPELLAALGASVHEALAVAADAELCALLVTGCTGFAFALERQNDLPLLIATANGGDLPVRQVLELGSWATTILKLGASVHPTTGVVATTFSSGNAAVAWYGGGVAYVACCATRAASALLLDNLARRQLRKRSARPAQNDWGGTQR